MTKNSDAMKTMALACLAGLLTACGGPGFDEKGADSGAQDATSESVVIVVPPQDGSADDASGEAGFDATRGDADATVGVAVSGHAVVGGPSGPVESPLSLSTTPLPFREIGIRDASGKVFTTSTDSIGAFQFNDITPPYDAIVYAGDPSGQPYLYLGLSTTDPRLAGSVALIGRNATVNLSVQLQDCGSSTCDCAISYWFPELDTYELGGCGPVSSSNLTVVPNPALPWDGPSSTTVDIHVLEWDPQNQHFWHVLAAALPVADRQTTSVGQLTAASVPTAGNITVTVATQGTASTWAPEANVQYNYANSDGFALLNQGSAPPLTSGLPNMIGASVTVGASASDPSSSLLQSAITFAGASQLPLSTTTVALTLRAPTTLTAPQANGSLSVQSAIGWALGAVGQVYSVTLSPLGNGDAGPVIGTPEAIVFTSGASIDLSRLADLSVTLALQSTWLSLVAQGQVASLDAMVDERTLATPDGSQGSIVLLPFTLTP